MSSRSKYRKLTDLYADGVEVLLDSDDGLVVMWVQALNKFEVEEARQVASTTRSRYTLAVKSVGSPEYDQVKAAFNSRTPEAVINELVANKATEHFLAAHQELEVDPEWKERHEIIRRTEDIEHLDPDHPERIALTEINAQWISEVQRLTTDNSDFYRRDLERLGPDELLETYLDEWLVRRAQSLALSEYNVCEIYYGARVCDAVPGEDGKFTKASHSACNHKERVYGSRDEVRELPDELWDMLYAAVQEVGMTVREAKNSPRPLSSSEPSQQPSSAEGSESSTADATH